MDEEQERLQPRRIPRQPRGIQRVAAITDAAEAIFAEMGYSAATTNQIAARAAVPIGSLYQFFPSKVALLHAVADRYLAGFSAYYGERLAVSEGGLRDRAAQLVDAMVIYGTRHKGFTRLILAPAGEPDVLAAATTLFQQLVEILGQLIAAAHPAIAPERRQLIAHASMTAIKALLAVAIVEGERDTQRAESLVGEAKTLLSSYLQAAIAAG